MTDEKYEELSYPQPTFVVRSLRDNPDYIKCPRCWHYTHEGLHNHDGLCDRCCNVLIESWPDHESIPHIKQRRAKPKREWVDLTDTQIEQVYFDMVQIHRGAPMPWGQVQFGRALLEKFKEVNT